MPRYTEDEARATVADSLSYAEALRKLGMRPAGGNHRLFKKWVNEIWQIPTDHFDPRATQRRMAAERFANRKPLAEILVEGSTYNRHNLKHRLYGEGIKEPVCEECGQDENWRGGVMALILDHINGAPDDNRLENLRVVCPNCAATFDTHCGRKNRTRSARAVCGICGQGFFRRKAKQRFCSKECGTRGGGEMNSAAHFGVPRPERRKVQRPPYDQLIAELNATSYLAVGRKYGVSDNAVRKWVRQYERERALRASAHDADIAA